MRDQTAAPAPISRRSLIGLAILAGGIAAVTFRVVETSPDFTGETLSTPDAHAKTVAGEIFLIDIRRPDEWRRTGVPEGAYPIDMRRKDFIGALADLTGADPTRPIALICARGVRSARLARKLSEVGYSRIIDVPEGMQGSASGPGWLARQLPTSVYKEVSQ